jgi:hypothetical protein
MWFVTRYGLRRVSCVAADRIDANHTKGWRQNWASNLDAMLDLFKEHRAEYTGSGSPPSRRVGVEAPAGSDRRGR